MSEPGSESGSAGAGSDRFTWHPEYRGQTVAEVRSSIRADIAHDQRAYHLAMEGAEQQEQAVLASVIDLEKRWGTFNLDWAEADPAVLADEVVAFELERERRQELFSYHEYRRDRTAVPPARAAAGMTTGTSSPGIRWGAIIAVAIVVVLILVLLLT